MVDNFKVAAYLKLVTSVNAPWTAVFARRSLRQHLIFDFYGLDSRNEAFVSRRYSRLQVLFLACPMFHLALKRGDRIKNLKYHGSFLLSHFLVVQSRKSEGFRVFRCEDPHFL